MIASLYAFRLHRLGGRQREAKKGDDAVVDGDKEINNPGRYHLNGMLDLNVSISLMARATCRVELVGGM